jgi:hypothetical protein
LSLDDVPINVPGIGTVRFDNLLEVEWKLEDDPFSKEGDSGSVVFDRGSQRPLGLLFAGGLLKRDGNRVGVSYACNLTYILKKLFNLQLL